MRIRAIDALNDFQFGKGKQSYLVGQQAIGENIQTRLLSFLNDCYFDLGAGIDWIRLLGTKSTQQEIILTCRGIILQSYGVVKVNSINAVLTGRSISIYYNIDTIFTSQYLGTLEVP